MAMTESQKKYEKKRMQSCKSYTIKYTPKEINESDRLQVYLNSTGLSANAYLKELVKRDLDNKGVAYPDMIDNDNNDMNND